MRVIPSAKRLVQQPSGYSKRFRLLKYCCGIWDASFQAHPDQRELRPIVPLVYYQGERPWPYASEFADLFAEWGRHFKSW